MCMRASEASELRKFRYFYILKLLFLSIFCRYISDALSVQMTCLSAYMYRQISQCTDKFPNVPTKVRKDIIGAPCPPPPPPSGYANVYTCTTNIMASQFVVQNILIKQMHFLSCQSTITLAYTFG